MIDLFLRRIVALFADIGLLIGLIAGLYAASGPGPLRSQLDDTATVFVWIPLVYFAAFWTFGGTPGQRALAIQVLSATGGKPNPAQAAVRFGVLYALVLLSVLSVGIVPLVLLLFAARGSPMPHDRIARTVVTARPVAFSTERLGLILPPPVSDGGRLPGPSGSPTGTFVARIGRAIGIGVIGLIGLVVVLLLTFGFGDSYTQLVVENGSDQDLRVAIRYKSLAEGSPQPLAAGASYKWERIGAPREQPSFRVRAFDQLGAEVYCHDVTYEEWQTLDPVPGTPRPLVIRPGGASCPAR